MRVQQHLIQPHLLLFEVIKDGSDGRGSRLAGFIDNRDSLSRTGRSEVEVSPGTPLGDSNDLALWNHPHFKRPVRNSTEATSKTFMQLGPTLAVPRQTTIHGHSIASNRLKVTSDFTGKPTVDIHAPIRRNNNASHEHVDHIYAVNTQIRVAVTNPFGRLTSQTTVTVRSTSCKCRSPGGQTGVTKIVEHMFDYAKRRSAAANWPPVAHGSMCGLVGVSTLNGLKVEDNTGNAMWTARAQHGEAAIPAKAVAIRAAPEPPKVRALSLPNLSAGAGGKTGYADILDA
jgi:hypothetical protein